MADLGNDNALIAIDRVFLHERTGAAALKSMAAAGRAVLDPVRVFAVMDHIVDTRPGRSDATLMPGGEAFITETRAACATAGITLFDVNDHDQGIVHVISPELGIVLPGVTLVAPDSLMSRVAVTSPSAITLSPSPPVSMITSSPAIAVSMRTSRRLTRTTLSVPRSPMTCPAVTDPTLAVPAKLKLALVAAFTVVAIMLSALIVTLPCVAKA